MKRLILMAAIASAALASCVKNEVIIDTPPQEIAYQTVIDPATKAYPVEVDFDKGHGFYSWAFMTNNNAQWSTAYASATEYFANVLIKSADNGTTWKNQTTEYYWPKNPNSSLTFFAWSDATASPSVTTATVTCNATYGIKITDYDVNANVNKDLMVAEVAADKTYSNSSSGVSTKFHHILSKLVFNVGLQEAYSGHTFTLTKISLSGVNTKSTYTQCAVESSTVSDKITDFSSWSTATDVPSDPLLAFSNSTVISATTPSEVTRANTDYEIMIPQTLTSEMKLTIEYTHAFGSSSETVTEVIPFVSSSDGSAVNLFGSDKWEPGKQYILSIKIGMNPIRWTPIIVQWEDVTAEKLL